jgi:AraC-like DNA-binding protein
MGDAMATDDTDSWVSVRSLDDFAELRKSQLESAAYWWPEIGPVGDTSSFSFTHRMRRLGPITVLDADFHDDVWVNGGELRPHYHVTVPVATSSAAVEGNFSVDAAPGSVAVYRPEGKAGVSSYVGRLLAVMIDREAVEDTIASALGRSVTSQIDFQPTMRTTTQAVRSWITMVSVFAEQLFRPRSVLHQPMVGIPFAESVVRGLLLATDHSYRATLEGESSEPPPRAIRAAIEFVEAEADQPLTVSALAARSHVSVRSLQHGFRVHVGKTPMAYLRDVRLSRAHQTLLESDPSTVTVASVAYRWGFTNLGRFAAAHAARYGESPLKTLRRRALPRSA